MHKKDLTTSIRQVDVVVLAVQLLGGDHRSIDTEDVAVKAHELVPGMFSWRKHPEQINLELIRVSLSDAKKTTHGGLLIGSGREGWRLSSNGLEWFQDKGRGLLDAETSWRANPRTAGSVDTVRRQRELARLSSSAAWEAWNASQSITLRDAQSTFRIDDYSSEKMIQAKLVRLRSLFDDDEVVSTFLKHAEQVINNGESD